MSLPRTHLVQFEVEMEHNWYEATVSAALPHRIISVVDWASDSPMPIPGQGILSFSGRVTVTYQIQTRSSFLLLLHSFHRDHIYPPLTRRTRLSTRQSLASERPLQTARSQSQRASHVGTSKKPKV